MKLYPTFCLCSRFRMQNNEVMKKIALLLIYSVMISCSADRTETLTEPEVVAFLNRYDSAWNSKNVIQVAKRLGDKYLYFDSKGGLTTLDKTLQFLADTSYVIHSANRSEIEVRVDGNIAIVTSHWIGELSWKGEPIHDNQRCGLTIIKKNGELKIVAEHCVAIVL